MWPWATSSRWPHSGLGGCTIPSPGAPSNLCSPGSPWLVPWALMPGPCSFTWLGQFHVFGALHGVPGTHFSSTAQLSWLHRATRTRGPPPKKLSRPALKARAPHVGTHRSPPSRPAPPFWDPCRPLRPLQPAGPPGALQGALPRRLLAAAPLLAYTLACPADVSRCRAGGGGVAAAAAGPAAALGLAGRAGPGPVMEAKKMNLPRGPENLCFDKDEFMKVGGGCWGRRAAEGCCGPGPGCPGGPPEAGGGGFPGGWEEPGALVGIYEFRHGSVPGLRPPEKRWVCHWKGDPGRLQSQAARTSAVASEQGFF